jgi:PAS domain S-box-containing protein
MSNIPSKEKAGKSVREIEQHLVNLKQSEQVLKENEAKYHDMIANLNTGFYSVTLDGKLLEYNNEFIKILGLKIHKGANGLQLSSFWKNPDDRNIYIDKLMKNGFIKNYELRAKKLDGEIIVVEANSRLIFNKQGKPFRIDGLFSDITSRKHAEEALKNWCDELETKVKQITNDLTETNIALKVILKKIENDQIEFEENILSNVGRLVFPFLKKLKKSDLDFKQINLLNTAESNLKKITSTFSSTLSLKHSALTATEIKIANLLIEGKTSKEIANLTSTQKSTIEFHRKNLRRKLGLKSKSENLKYHLLSIR